MQEKNKYEMLSECMQTPPRSDYAREFLAAVDRAVSDLMPTNKLAVEHVAAKLCISPSKLRRQLAFYARITPANYLMMLRMRKAVSLLEAYPKYPISDIASSCGFSDHAHFTHAFVRFFGKPPMQYVQEHNKHQAGQA